MKNKPNEQAVIVHFQYGSTDLTPLFLLEDKLDTAIASAGVGEFDGNEIAADGSDGSLFMYGPSADALFQIVEPILRTSRFMRGARVVRRYGPVTAPSREVEVILN